LLDRLQEFLRFGNSLLDRLQEFLRFGNTSRDRLQEFTASSCCVAGVAAR